MNNYDTQVRERLAAIEVRYTGGRKAVVSALATARGPRSAAELHEEMRGLVPLSSLYRSLAVLQEGGVVEPHHGQGGVVRFELAEWLSGHHHHLVCVECGAVEDVELASGLEEALEKVVGELTGEASFAALGHSLEVEGHCARCA